MAQMILGVFQDPDEAAKVIDHLRSSGVDAQDISVVLREGEVGTKGGVAAEGPSISENITKAATTGAATGGVLGGLAGLLIGIGAIVIPGGFLIGGPIAAALGLTGAAATTISGMVTGAVAGGLAGGLMGLGLPREEAEFYEDRVQQGAVLVAAVIDDSTEDEIRKTMEMHNAEQIRTVSTK